MSRGTHTLACLAAGLCALGSASQDPAKEEPARRALARCREDAPASRGRGEAPSLPGLRSALLHAHGRLQGRGQGPQSGQHQPLPGMLSVAGDDGQARSIPVTLRTRGHSRLTHNCDFVPIRVEFPQGRRQGNAVREPGSAEAGDPLLRLQGARAVPAARVPRLPALQSLHPALFSRPPGPGDLRRFQARQDRSPPVMRSSSSRTVTWRAAWRDASPSSRVTLFRNLDAESLTLLMLFEYMIGNTDFSIHALHNVRLVQNQARVLLAVPYDFDYSRAGGRPLRGRLAKLLRLKTVRERAYRGPCRTRRRAAAVPGRVPGEEGRRDGDGGRRSRHGHRLPPGRQGVPGGVLLDDQQPPAREAQLVDTCSNRVAM